MSIGQKPAHIIQGEKAEDKALQFLLQEGLSVVSRNYRCKSGEIDLIMREDNALVIVEVRYRKNAKFGSALESITVKKQSRIIAATYHYLTANKMASQPIRFDVVAMTGEDDFNWIKNAFLAGF